MIRILKCYISLWVLLLLVQQGIAQQAIDCNPLANLPISKGEVNVNYGSATNAFNFRNRSSFTVGQPFIESSVGLEYNINTGFWTRFLLPPKAPLVAATQGEFPDRVQIQWNLDPLGADPSEGYVVTRGGSFLAQVDRKVRQFIDFNVQAGEIYEYGVYGRNQFGNGVEGKSLGFVNPNGVVTGLITTPNGNPVPGTIVRLTPVVGTALSFDGVDDYLCVTHTAAVPTEMWTVSAYVKIGDTYDRSGIIDLGSDINKNFWIHTTPSSMGKGVVIGTGDGSQSYEITHEFADDPNGWHQVTAVYAAGNLLLYIDGQYVTSIKAQIASEAALFTIGTTRNHSSYFTGNIDDVRLYNRPLTSTEIFLNKDITVPGNSAGLVAYWKFDEGLGDRSFDISPNEMHAYVFGPSFTNDHSKVQNAGISDETGFYAIEGINYSKVENFTATPSKVFYERYALEFNAAYQAYATLTDFDLPDTSVVQIVFQPYDLLSRQSILSKGSDFELWIEAGQLHLTISGEDQILGPVSSQYQQIALAMNAGANEVTYYRNGTLINTRNYTSISGDWTGASWQLAAKGSTPSDYFTGLIDEVAFFNDSLSIQTIQLHASKFGNGGIDIGHPALFHYFDLNDGVGETIEDIGFENAGSGTFTNASWSIITYNQKSVNHRFRPSTRLVNINFSNTAASGIDFTNESLINVSGVVRFDKTFCYQDSVEILVNGERFFPPIYTNSDGRFSAEFEPGSTISLTPKFGAAGMPHLFSPGFYRVRNINRPIAGILFANQTKRIVDGQISGGDGKLSVIYTDEANPNASDIVRIKVQAANQCLEREITIDDESGKFSFTELPPIPLTVALSLHTNPDVMSYIQAQGGETKDMRNTARDTVDFRYYAAPQVWMEPFEETICPNGATTPFPTIEESGPLNGNRLYNKTLRMYEDYVGGRDWLQNFDLVVTNNLDDLEPELFQVRDTSAFKYQFFVGKANIAGDFTKFIQVQGISPRGEQSVEVQRAIVLGKRPRESSFVTKTPTLPTVILRDPPGDASFATWEAGTSSCTTIKDVTMKDFTDTQTQTLALGHKFASSTGIGFAIITELKVLAESTYTGTKTTSNSTEREAQVCVTSTRTISTSGSDAITGDQADLYVGNAINLAFSANDVLWLDPNTCEISGDSVTVSVDFQGFDTEFIYSEWQILTSVIPNLELVGDTISARTWRNTVQRNKDLKSRANLKKNLTFDGLASVTETSTSTSIASETVETTVTLSGDFANEIGFTINDASGFKSKFGWVWGDANTSGTTNAVESTTTISYTLADDDPNDSYTVDILDEGVYGTPVFRLRAGESMCPWVPGTLNREEIGFQIDRLTAVDVPATQAATFRVTMSNLGQTGRDP
jgi:hypothetical protein